MPINTSSNNEFYLQFHNSGPSAALIVPAALLNLVTVSGVIMNTFVVAVTVASKTLHGTANFLLAMISLFEVLHQTGHTIFLVIQVSGINFISNMEAVRMELVMLFGVNAALCGMASAAFDRLFAVVAQHRHRRMNKPIYLAIHGLVCTCFGGYTVFYVYEYYSTVDPDSPTTGCVAELLSGPIGEQFFKYTAALNALSALLYLIIWIVIKCKKGVTKETSGRLLKSLVIILVINIGGYFVNLSIYQILFNLPPGALPVLTIWHIGFVAGIALNAGAACNALILYFNSTEYRKAFKRVLYKAFLLLMAKGDGLETANSRVRYFRTTQVQPSSHSGPPAAAALTVNTSSSNFISGSGRQQQTTPYRISLNK